MSKKMEVKVCQQCKGMFQTSIPVEMCPICQNVVNRLFAKVKMYIRNHKSAGVAQVSEDCHVSSKQILEWIREERLYFDKDSQVALPCMECGTLINSGKYCDACKKKLHKNLSSVCRSVDESHEPIRTDRIVSIKKRDRLRFS